MTRYQIFSIEIYPGYNPCQISFDNNITTNKKNAINNLILKILNKIFLNDKLYCFNDHDFEQQEEEEEEEEQIATSLEDFHNKTNNKFIDIFDNENFETMLFSNDFMYKNFKINCYGDTNNIFYYTDFDVTHQFGINEIKID